MLIASFLFTVFKEFYENFKINIEEIMADIIIKYVQLNPVKTRVLKALVFLFLT